MRAAVLFEPGSALRVEDVQLASPGRGEVRVRIQAAGVCHSDLHYMHGDLQVKLPAVLGHEGVGIVESVGEAVTRVSPGDTVIMTWRPRCGNCEFCARGRPALCRLGRITGATGGLLDGTTRLSLDGQPVHHLMGVACFAEEAVVAEQSVIPIAADIPINIAAIAGCAVVTGVGVVLNRMQGATGQGAMVIGSGGVGLSAIMGLKLIGAYPIVAVDTVDARLELARSLGATHTVNAASQDLAEEIAALGDGAISWAIDAVGSAATLSQAVDLVSAAGTVIAVGLGKVGATFPVPINVLVQQEKQVIGSLYGSSNTVVQVPKILDLYRAGRLPLDALVGQEYSLSDVNAAYEALASGSTGRSIIVP